MMAGLGTRLAMRAPDLPGHGRTDYDPEQDFHDQATSDALAALVGIGPALVLGHSIGGTVALRIAVARPDLLRALVLIEPVAFAFLADAGHPGYTAETAASRGFAEAARAGDWRRAAEVFVARWGAGGGLDGLLPDQADYMVARMPLVVASEAAILDTPAPRLRLSDIAAIEAPVLLIEGTRSPRVVSEILDVIEARLPRAERVRIDGAGHMAPVTHPGPVSDAVLRFLEAEQA